MRNRGYKTFFTARDVAQTVGLLENAGESFLVLDKSFPRNSVSKLFKTIKRAKQLSKIIKDNNVACGINHISRSAILGGWFSNIPIMTMYDYEYISTFIPNRFATKVLIPDAVNYHSIKTAKINKKNLVLYPHLKENIYLDSFIPEPNFYERFQIPNIGKIIISFRPPAENSHYHNKESELILNKFLEHIINYKNKLFFILLPRDNNQGNRVAQFFERNKIEYMMPIKKPLPGPDTIFNSDIVITGGGTMAREAAVLGTPAYSIFKGKKGAIDAYLEAEGRLVFINSTNDVDKIKFNKKNVLSCLVNKEKFKALNFISDQIEYIIKSKPH